MAPPAFDPRRGCALFKWASDAPMSSKEVLTLLFRTTAEQLAAAGIHSTEIGPGKGCPVAVGVSSPEGEVTIIGGEEAGRLWIATWGAVEEKTPIAQGSVAHTVSVVRSALAHVLAADARASDARWMTFPEWAALGARGQPSEKRRP
jgi:hypothetical protein